MATQEKRKEGIGERLALARRQAGLTQAQVAKLVDLHRPSISEMEAGRRCVSTDELVGLADIYGVDVEWLAKNEPEKGARDEKVELAARELGKLKDEDLDRVLNLLSSIRSA